MGKEKRKHSRSSSRERKRSHAKSKMELQRMQDQLNNFSKLVESLVSKNQSKKYLDDDYNKENDSRIYNSEEELVNSISQCKTESVVNRQNSPSESVINKEMDKDSPIKENVVDEEILGLLGEDPNVIQGEVIRFHPEIKTRWQTWMKEGDTHTPLSEENRKGLILKYPRKGELYAESPKINLEVSAAMSEVAKRRDDHFVETQKCVGTVIVSLGAAMSLLLNNSEDGIDQMKLMKFLCDTGKLLTDVFHQQSVGRKSFNTPMMKKSVKLVVEATHSDEWLYGLKLADQIKETKVIETACQNLKVQDKKFPQRVQNQGNWKGLFKKGLFNTDRRADFRGSNSFASSGGHIGQLTQIETRLDRRNIRRRSRKGYTIPFDVSPQQYRPSKQQMWKNEELRLVEKEIIQLLIKGVIEKCEKCSGQ